MMITNEAVDRAAAVTWARRNGGNLPAWNEALEDSRLVDKVEEVREEVRLVLEAALPQLVFDILMVAADDLAGERNNSRLENIVREFRRHDGEQLAPEHESYVEGMEESREFLYQRAHETLKEAKTQEQS